MAIPAAARGDIEGYADRTSALPGQQLRLFVSTTAAGFAVRAFRMSWYRGAEGKLVWTSQHLPGRHQHSAVLASTVTHTITARGARR